MDNIDDFLNSIGLNQSFVPEVPEQEVHSTGTQASVNAEETLEQKSPFIAQPTEDIDETPENDDSEEVIQVLSDLERDFSDTLVVEEGEISTAPRETLSPEEAREAENLFGELFSEDTTDDEDNTDEEEEDWEDVEDNGENWETTPDETIDSLDSLEENNSSPEEEQLPLNAAEETTNEEPEPIPEQEETVEEEIVEQEEETQEATLGEGKFPQNSPTLLVDESTSRFSGAMWYDEIRNKKVLIAGIGGIGSHTALQIGRMCPATIYLYDDDMVERGNMSGQMYGNSQVGMPKVDAMSSTLAEFTSAKCVYSIAEKFTSSTDPCNIMICGFDNMNARMSFYSAWKKHVEGKDDSERERCLYIDGRLSINMLQVLCITGADKANMDRYEKEFLFSSSEVEHTVCSLKQTTYMASMIGSIITNLFTNFVADTLKPDFPCSLPFFTAYDAENMVFITEE